MQRSQLRFLLVSFLLTVSVCISAQNIVSDSLKLLLRETPNAEKINVYQTIITGLWRNNPDSALFYAKQAVQFADEQKDIRTRAIAFRLYGGAYFYLGKYDSVLIHTKYACKLALESGDSSLIASSLSNIGEVYIHMGNYPEGLENLLQSLNIKHKINQKYGLANTLNNIGLLYLKLKDYANARKFSMEAMKVSDEVGDNNPKLFACNTIGFTYLYTGDLEEAKKYFKQSIVLEEKNYNLTWYAMAYSGLGQVYLNSNQPAQARVYFNKALNLYIKINDKVGTSEMYYLLSKIHVKKRDLDSAFYFLKLSKKWAEATGSRELKLDNFRLQEELYTQQGKYDSALLFKSKYMELHDTMFNESMMRTLSNIELKVSEEEAQRVLDAKDILIKRKTYQTNFLIVIILIVLIFSFILFRSYRLIKRQTRQLVKSKEEIGQKAELLEGANNDIRLKNEELEQQTEEILSQRDSLANARLIIESKNKELEGANVLLEQKVMLRTAELNKANQDLRENNKELDHFIYRSSHDLKGPLARLLGLCHLGKMETKESQARDYFEKLHATASEMNEMLTKLINIHEISVKTITEVPINLKSKVKDSFSIANNRLRSHGLIRLESQVDDGIILNTDEELIENLFTILVENAIRYKDTQKADQFLKITASCADPTRVHLVFGDNGIGIPPELGEQLFDMFVVGENSHKGHGLGLYEAKVIAKKLKGSIGMRNSKNGLTEFEVTLPLQKQ